MARLFFSVSLPSLLGQTVNLLQSRIRDAAESDRVRPVPPEQAHFTLRFLGEQPESGLLAAARAGRRVRFAPFDVTVDKIGVFPSHGKPHTLWVGPSDAENWGELVSTLADRLREEGFADEPRPFVPHLTIARLKDGLSRSELRALLRAFVPMGAFRVDAFGLMDSRPEGGVHVHTLLEQFCASAVPTTSRIGAQSEASHDPDKEG